MTQLSLSERLQKFRGRRTWDDDDDWQGTERLKHSVREHVGHPPKLGFSDDLFDRVVDWKLRRQRARTEHLRKGLSSEILSSVTQCVFSLTHDDPIYLAKVRAGILAGLPGVGLGLASAILTLAYPEDYAIVDVRLWRVVFNENRSSFSVQQFADLLREVRSCAEQLQWPVQHVDFFAWKYFETLPGAA